jgi:hypothetical protein
MKRVSIFFYFTPDLLIGLIDGPVILVSPSLDDITHD